VFLAVLISSAPLAAEQTSDESSDDWKDRLTRTGIFPWLI